MTENQRLRLLEEAARDAFPTLTRCAFCPDWTYLGTAVEGREVALRHRLELHPEATIRRARKPHLMRFRRPVLDAEEKALVEFERQRRARLHGVTLSGQK